MANRKSSAQVLNEELEQRRKAYQQRVNIMEEQARETRRRGLLSKILDTLASIGRLLTLNNENVGYTEESHEKNMDLDLDYGPAKRVEMKKNREADSERGNEEKAKDMEKSDAVRIPKVQRKSEKMKNHDIDNVDRVMDDLFKNAKDAEEKYYFLADSGYLAKINVHQLEQQTETGERMMQKRYDITVYDSDGIASVKKEDLSESDIRNTLTGKGEIDTIEKKEFNEILSDRDLEEEKVRGYVRDDIRVLNNPFMKMELGGLTLQNAGDGVVHYTAEKTFTDGSRYIIKGDLEQSEATRKMFADFYKEAIYNDPKFKPRYAVDKEAIEESLKAYFAKGENEKDKGIVFEKGIMTYKDGEVQMQDFKGHPFKKEQTQIFLNEVVVSGELAAALHQSRDKDIEKPFEDMLADAVSSGMSMNYGVYDMGIDPEQEMNEDAKDDKDQGQEI